jgi:hypothetical protein
LRFGTQDLLDHIRHSICGEEWIQPLDRSSQSPDEDDLAVVAALCGRFTRCNVWPERNGPLEGSQFIEQEFFKAGF